MMLLRGRSALGLGLLRAFSPMIRVFQLILGMIITGLMREKMYRLRKWQSRLRVSDAAERNLAFALSELDRTASQLKLPKHVEEEAARLYREAVRKELIRGRSIESVIAACVYAACRLLKIPRTLDEIADIARVTEVTIRNRYKELTEKFTLKIQFPFFYIPS